MKRIVLLAVMLCMAFSTTLASRDESTERLATRPRGAGDQERQSLRNTDRRQCAPMVFSEAADGIPDTFAVKDIRGRISPNRTEVFISHPVEVTFDFVGDLVYVSAPDGSTATYVTQQNGGLSLATGGLDNISTEPFFSALDCMDSVIDADGVDSEGASASSVETQIIWKTLMILTATLSTPAEGVDPQYGVCGVHNTYSKCHSCCLKDEAVDRGIGKVAGVAKIPAWIAFGWAGGLTATAIDFAADWGEGTCSFMNCTGKRGGGCSLPGGEVGGACGNCSGSSGDGCVSGLGCCPPDPEGCDLADVCCVHPQPECCTEEGGCSPL